MCPEGQVKTSKFCAASFYSVQIVWSNFLLVFLLVMSSTYRRFSAGMLMVQADNRSRTKAGTNPIGRHTGEMKSSCVPPARFPILDCAMAESVP